MKKFKYFSLFSGAGGMDLGFAPAEFSVLFGNDILDEAAETFASNFNVKKVNETPSISELPAVLKGNVEKLELRNFRNLELDIIIGGPPCQDFSIVRGPDKERAGISVSRGRLYSHFVRALAHLQPKVFVFENVPGLVSSNKREAYTTILEDFGNLNYRWDGIKRALGNNLKGSMYGYEIVHSSVIDASKLGVPQSRRRLIIIGLRKDISPTRIESLNELKGEVASILSGKNSLTSKYPLTPLEVFEGKVLPDLAEKYANIMKQYEELTGKVKTPKALKWKKDVWEKLTFEVVKDYLAVNKINTADDGEINSAFAEHKKLLSDLGYDRIEVSKLISADGTNKIPIESVQSVDRMKMTPPGENHEFVSGTKWEVEGRGMSLIYRRIHPLKPSYTVVAHGGGGTSGYHYERDRSKLTNREKARLQTFPDRFVFKGGISQVRAQIGEAVPPFLGKKIAESIKLILGFATR